MDTDGYNVNLYHFAYALGRPTSNVLFWAVTVVNSPREMPDVRLAIGSNSASVWWVNGKEVIGIYNDRQTVIDDGVSRRLTLQKGPNIVRAAIINGGGATDFCARFLDRRVPTGQGHHGESGGSAVSSGGAMDVIEDGSEQSSPARLARSQRVRRQPRRRRKRPRRWPAPCAAARGERHKDSRLLSAELQRERTAGVPAEQHGRAGRHRRRHHCNTTGSIPFGRS